MNSKDNSVKREELNVLTAIKKKKKHSDSVTSSVVYKSQRSYCHFKFWICYYEPVPTSLECYICFLSGHLGYYIPHI